MKKIGKHKLYRGDCLEVLKKFKDASVDSIVTDPPYGLRYQGKKWDYDVPSTLIWRECLRVLKPGGHLLAFAGTRTQHRMASRIEKAGFELRDMFAWCYSGQSTPKSLDISKAIDRAAGAKRKVVGINKNHRSGVNSKHVGTSNANITAPATKAARQWNGWGSGVKPCYEPISLARKPLEGSDTVITNIQKHGTGGLNIDGCRFHNEQDSKAVNENGRWPTNLLLEQSKDVAEVFGSNARFYYCAKPSKNERGVGNTHETVKPIAVMQWLCKLITQPHGIVLDPFMGSGTTGIACTIERFRFIGIEREPSYFKIARGRIKQAFKECTEDKKSALPKTHLKHLKSLSNHQTGTKSKRMSKNKRR